MRRIALAGALLALTLAACGGDDDDASTTTPSATPEPSRTPVSVQAAFAAQDPQVVLVQVASSGACPLDQVRYVLTETPEQVSVQVTAGPSAQACTGEPELGNVEVPLEAALGDRELVDGSTGDVVQVATGDPPGPAVPTIEAEQE